MKKVAVLLAEGFEEIEALTVVDVIRRAGEVCDLVSIQKNSVLGAHNIEVKADKIISDDIKTYDMVVLPGGLPGATNLQKDSKVIELIRYFNQNKKYIAAICAAPIVLAEAGIIKNKDITAYPGFEEYFEDANYIETQDVVVDGNIITSRGPATALEFSYRLLEKLENNSAEKLKQGMMYNFFIKGKRGVNVE